MAKSRKSETREIDVADRLHSAAIHVLRSVAREDERSGLTAARLSALSVVVFAGPLSLRDLATAERVQAPTITRTVQGLEAAGLVTRDEDPQDGRVVRIRATPKGRRVLQAARARRVRKLAQRLATLDRESVATLDEAADLLERLARND